MRIVQLIDSLIPGGAEKMAVNYANSLAGQIEFSGIVATRTEGALRPLIASSVSYLFLNRKTTFDIKAVLRLREFCARHHIQIIHAHGSSFFIAVMLKLIYPSIKIVWHEHNGARDTQQRRHNIPLIIASRLFSGIIAVNRQIEVWAADHLHCRNVIYLPNFTSENAEMKETILNGENGKRILCLANLRHPKNHMLIVEAASVVLKKFPGWTFHFVGNDLQDNYSKQVKQEIQRRDLSRSVYIYGLKNDIRNIIDASEICLLSSDYEGLPVSLIEYGAAGKAVVSTDVGAIPSIIKNGLSGFTVPAGNAGEFARCVMQLAADQDLRRSMGAALLSTVAGTYSESAVMEQYLKWLESL